MRFKKRRFGGFRNTMRSFRPRFRRRSGSRSFKLLGMSTTTLLMVGAALFFFVPSVKSFITNIFKKQYMKGKIFGIPTMLILGVVLFLFRDKIMPLVKGIFNKNEATS